MKWFYLGIAILGEITATSALKSVEGFSKIVPILIVIAGYSTAFFFLRYVLEMIPIGIAYAIWSGVGIVLISLIGYFYHKQVLDLPAVIGIAFITIGVIIINLFSKSVVH